MLLYLVNDMLDIFQIKNGKFQYKEESVRVREALMALIEMFELQVK